MKTIQHLAPGAKTFAAVLLLSFFSISASAAFSPIDSPQVKRDLALISTAEIILEAGGDSELARSISLLRENAPVLSATDWKAYGDNLQDALKTGHEGLQNSALRLIVAYGDQLQLGNDAVVDVMRLYREGTSDQTRRMAVVALGEIDSDLALNYLERSRDFEKSETVQRTINAVVSAHRAS
jgi:hypothetical protein